MMTAWILIAILDRNDYSDIAFTAEFNSRTRCEEAADLIQMKEDELETPSKFSYVICVAK